MTFVYVGTYAGQVHVYDVDSSSGALRHVQSVSATRNPSYLAFGSRGQMLYAVNEQIEAGAVSAFAVDPASAQLTFVNQVAAQGADPAHLSADPSGAWLLVANYTGGTIAVLPVQPDGALGEATDVVRHTGRGPHSDRQQGPHPHMILADPRGEFTLVPDLGIDTVVAYRLDRGAGRLVAQPEAGGRLAPGAGPRHLAFSADGRHAYVLGELNSTLVVFEYDGQAGRLQQLQVVSTVPDGLTAPNTSAALVVAPSGRFVYASNRGHDSVAAFAIDAHTGLVTLASHTPTEGRTPRDINLDPQGKILLAANQDSDSIVSFFVDDHTGELAPTGHRAEVSAPTRVLFTAP